MGVGAGWYLISTRGKFVTVTNVTVVRSIVMSKQIRGKLHQDMEARNVFLEEKRLEQRAER